MLAFYLSQLRRKDTFDIKVPKQDMSILLTGRRSDDQSPQPTSGFSRIQKRQNLPFANLQNPFKRR